MADIDPNELADSMEPPGDGDSDAPGGDDLQAAMGDLLDAIGKKDPKAMADAFRAAVAFIDSKG